MRCQKPARRNVQGFAQGRTKVIVISESLGIIEIERGLAYVQPLQSSSFAQSTKDRISYKAERKGGASDNRGGRGGGKELGIGCVSKLRTGGVGWSWMEF